MKQLFFLLAATVLLFSCKIEDHDKSGTFKDPATSVYQGEDGSSVKLNHQGKPEQVILTLSNFERAIPQPAKFQKESYYPAKLRIAKHDSVIDIIFDALTLRQAS